MTGPGVESTVSSVLAGYAEARDLGRLEWITPQAVGEALYDFDAMLARASAVPGALGQYARASRPISRMWAQPGMLKIDFDNPGYLEFDEHLRLSLNPLRWLPWWLARGPGWGSPRGEALRRAYLGYVLGMVQHDVTHMMIWIAHRRIPGFHTLWMAEELNCTLWGSTMSHLGVTGELIDLQDPQVQQLALAASKPAIFEVHIRDYLKDRASMLSAGASMESMFGPVAEAVALMEAAEEPVPEHPAGTLAYRWFAGWARDNNRDPLDPEMFQWGGWQDRFPAAKRGAAQPGKRARAVKS